MAVSEAVGTVLLLGISVMLAGGIALWTAQIDEGEEGLYVDLWAYVQGDDLVVNHRGGDLLEGDQTYVTLRDSSGTELIRNTYTVFSGTGDDRWDPGEQITIDISVGVTDNFDLVVTTVKKSGTPTVVLSNSLVKTSSASGLPDLAITRLTIMNSDSTPVTRMNDDGTYIIGMRVDNFGSDMTTQYFGIETDNTISNIRLFDQLDDLVFSTVQLLHFDDTGTEIGSSDAQFGILETGHYIEVSYNWNRPPSNPRTLGMHTLNAKVVPFFQGEQNYRNNYVERDFKVDKLVKPLPIFGPDPGIYDISFSNDAPNSGDEVTVTVIIQNSGDQAINVSHGVHLVVSTWRPEIHSTISGVSYNWRVDHPSYYGDWRNNAGYTLVDDNIFPTCVKPNIALLPGAYFFYYFTLEARVDVPGGQQWVYAAIDVYDNPGHLEGVAIESGDDTDDNFGLGNIQVLPKIMLVDDDGAPMNAEDDMTSAVLEALVGSGVNVDKVYVAQEVEDDGVTRDAPAYNYTQTEIAAPAMEDYDIVIWVTGNVTDPLTNTVENLPTTYGGNIQELMKYLDSNRYLMLVGARPFEGLMEYFSGSRVDPGAGHFNPSKNAQEAQAASDLLYQYLGILNVYINQQLPTDDPPRLWGLDDGTDGLTPDPAVGDYNITLLEQTAGNDLMQFYNLRTDNLSAVGFELPVGMITTESELSSTPPWVNTVRSTSVPDAAHSNATFKSVVVGWDITQIKYLNEKINLIAEILKWFDWEINVGRDMAITKMQLSILTEVPDGSGGTTWDKSPIGEDNLPKYLDTILIEATVRNNGPAVESTSVMFYVTGPDGIELPVATGIPDPRFGGTRETYDNPQDVGSIQGEGGEVEIFKLWLAVGVGSYTFRVVVDPYHLVNEISEENNDITYSTSTVTSFVTQNNILLVDDDSSEDNFDSGPMTQGNYGAHKIDYSGIGGEPSDVVNDVLVNLGYDHETYTVVQSFDGSDWTYDSGLGILDLKRYNSIIWVTGDAGGGRPGVPDRETLTNNDMLSLISYLDGLYAESEYLPVDHHENVLFMGEGLMRDLMLHKADNITATLYVEDFIDLYIGADSTGSLVRDESAVLVGPDSGEYTEDIYVGIEYMPEHFMGLYDFTSIPLPAVQGAFQETTPGLYTYGITQEQWYLTSIQHEMADTDNDNYFRTITHTWQSRFAEHDVIETALHELLYLSLHWFNTPEDKPELLSRNSKIILSEGNPVLGNSYLVEIEVVNLGGVPGGGTVRFMDGGTLVKSENIYLDPDVSTTLEAIWTPLYAGNRTLMVIIDLYDDYDEVFDTLNNVPVHYEEVFFFWDDMEEGDANWETDSTVLLINGEGKLDYMEEPTFSDIQDQWGDMDGFHLNNNIGNPYVEGMYQSSNISYMMHEPNGEIRKPVDVTFVIDTSGSMGSNNKIQDARRAASTFVGQMTEHDRVSIFIFDNEVFDHVLPLTNMDAAGKSVAQNIIGGLRARGYTPLWDTTGAAVKYAYDNVETGRTPAVITLTDGDDWGTNGRETGSESYAPGSEPGTDYKHFTWGAPGGLRWGDATYDFNAQDGNSNHDVYRYINNGRSYANWVNLRGGSDTRTGLLEAPVYVFTIGLATNPHTSTYTNGDSSPPTHPTRVDDPDLYQFTTEYDLWNVADKSSFNGNGKGKYYYAPTSTELQNIYDDIFVEIQNLAQQATRSGDTRAIVATPEAHWALDDGTGGTAMDSENGHHASVGSGNWGSGQIGDCYEFDGSTTKMRVPSHSNLNNMNIVERSIAFWFKLDDTNNRQVLFKEGDQWDGINIYVMNDQIHFGFWSDTLNALPETWVSAPMRDDTTWHHAAFIFDGTGATQSYYLDGVNVGTQSISGFIRAHPDEFNFGYSADTLRYRDGWYSSASTLDGRLDEIWLFSDLLSDLEVQELFETGWEGQNGLRAEYYDGDRSHNNQFFTDLFTIQIDPNVDNNWGNGRPMTGMDNDDFSVRWTGYVEPLYTEAVTFYTRSDDGARLYIDDILVIGDAWRDQSPREYSSLPISLKAGKRYSVVMEYYENGGGAVAQLSWSSPSLSKQIIPTTQLFLHPGLDTGDEGGEGGGGGAFQVDPLNPWTDGSTTNSDKHLETDYIDLRYVDDARLSFYQKYNLKVGSNGGVIMVGIFDTGNYSVNTDLENPDAYKYKYIQPDQPYTGNTHTDFWGLNTDDYGTPIRWCWNGKSGGGTLEWEYISVDLTRFAGNYVKVKFQYVHNYGGTGFGWMIDNVRIDVSSDVDNPNKDQSMDNWDIVKTENLHGDGTMAWFAGDPNLGDDFKDGIDNSLYTRPIDLTNARTAILDGRVKFNIDEASGRPPDGFRVEISKDNGVSWIPLSLGVRTSWGVSGTEGDASDNVPGDGKSFTGLPDEKNSYNWVRVGSLTRLITNLNGFIGNTVILRFRVVTNNDDPDHFEDPAAFKGLYVDDIRVYGESLEGTRSSAEDILEDYYERVARHEMERGPPEKGASIELPKRASIDDEPVTGEETSDLTTGEELSTPVAVIAGGVLIAIPLVAVKVNRKYKRKH